MGKMTFADKADSTVVAAIAGELAVYDLHGAAAADMVEARKFAANLIGPDIVSAATLQMVHERSGAGLFLAREEGALTGVLAFVLLNDVGFRAVREDVFDAVSPLPAHVAGRGQAPVAVYGWGIAATGKPSAIRLVEGAKAMARNAVAHLPYFGRAATDAGVRLMRERLGFQDWPGSTSGLLWRPPILRRQAAA
jgi:hypothetical protein